MAWTHSSQWARLVQERRRHEDRRHHDEKTGGPAFGHDQQPGPAVLGGRQGRGQRPFYPRRYGGPVDQRRWDRVEGAEEQ